MYHYWDQNFGKCPPEELYNIAEDPDALHNLADDPEYQEMKQKLESELYQKLKKQDDPRMFGRGHVFDEYRYKDDDTYNFYYQYMSGEQINTEWINNSDFEKEPLPIRQQ